MNSPTSPNLRALLTSTAIGRTLSTAGPPAIAYKWAMADEGSGGLAAYAAARRLEGEGDRHLPRTTPPLAGAELGSVDEVVRGWLATYVEAQLAVLTRSDSRFTV